MDYERNDTPQGEEWIDDVLGESPLQSELGPDEHAVHSAGLIHPDDMELEMILAEHREEETDLPDVPMDYDVPIYDEEEFSDEEPEPPQEKTRPRRKKATVCWVSPICWQPAFGWH